MAAMLGKKSCTYYSFASKVMCTKCGAERPTSHFGGHVGDHFGEKVAHIILLCTIFGTERTTSHFTQVRPLAMAAILAAIFENKIDEKLHLNAKVLCAKFG